MSANNILLCCIVHQNNSLQASNCFVIFSTSGHDTTASGISWTLYLLAKHPEYQSQVQAEVDEVISQRGSDRLDW